MTEVTPSAGRGSTDPAAAEAHRILRSRVDLTALPPLSRAVTEAVLCATADFDYVHDLVCHEAALADGVAAIAAGVPVVTDSAMVAAGIAGHPVICKSVEPLAARLSRTTGITLAAAGIRLGFGEAGPGAVWVVGDAPDALAEILRRLVDPALVIGLPAGLDGAAAAKAALRASGIPSLSNVSEKGGATAAVAALGALLRLAAALSLSETRWGTFNRGNRATGEAAVTELQDGAYLLGLRLHGRRVVVIGGGAVAARRIPRLLAAGADVLLVSPSVTATLEDLAGTGRITWLARAYQPGDCAGAWLVCACAGPAAVNAAVADEAERERTWCVRADDAAAATAWTPATGTATDVTVGVLSGDPRYSAAIRDAITAAIGAGTISARHWRRHGKGVALIGGGPGDPGLITVRGRQLLAEADVVITDRLAPRELLAELPPDVIVVDAGKIPYGRAMSQEEINEALVGYAEQGLFVVRLKGGDPFVFGRGGEEMLACLRAGVPVTVVPGISSSVGVPTANGLPVTHRGVAQSFHVISVHVAPGDSRSTVDWAAVAKEEGTLVLMMGVERIGAVAEALLGYGRPASTPVSVIADGTMPTQRTIYSSLGEVAERVADEGIRPPAVVVIGGVVDIAAEIAGLAKESRRA